MGFDAVGVGGQQRGVAGVLGEMHCPPGLVDLGVGGFLGRVGHHPVRVVVGGAVAVVGVEVEMHARQQQPGQRGPARTA